MCPCLISEPRPPKHGLWLIDGLNLPLEPPRVLQLVREASVPQSSSCGDFNGSHDPSGRQVARFHAQLPPLRLRPWSIRGVQIDALPDVRVLAAVFPRLFPAQNLLYVGLPDADGPLNRCQTEFPASYSVTSSATSVQTRFKGSSALISAGSLS